MIDMPNLVIDLNHAPIFEWYVITCGAKNGCQQDTYLKLHFQTMMIALGSTINVRSGKETCMTI